MIICCVCGEEITLKVRYTLESGRVLCAEHVNPWAEGDKAAAPANEEQEDGE